MEKIKSTESSFMFYPEITDEKFNEKLYLKKEFRDIEIKEKGHIDKKKDFSLSEHQIFLRNYISPDTPYNGILVYHGVGSGKCLLKGTPIVMNDGTIKNVEDIQDGDLLMGDDSTPRTVLSLARGNDKMYSIIQENNDTYTVNSEHILCLKASNYPLYSSYNDDEIIIDWIENNDFCYKIFNKLNKEKANHFFNLIKKNESTSNNILEISIKNYLELHESKKKILKGYRVPIELSTKYTNDEPYKVGYELFNFNSIDINSIDINSIDINSIDINSTDKVYELPYEYKFNDTYNRLELLSKVLF
jgi:hypothetical protein